MSECPNCAKLEAEVKKWKDYGERTTVKLLDRDLEAIEHRQKMVAISNDLKKVLPW